MGGKKRPTLSQLAKKAEKEQQQQKAAKKKEEGGGKKAAVTAEEKLIEALAKELPNLNAVTAYDVASKYSVKMTLALRALRALKEKGDLVLIAKGHRTEVYAPAKRAAAS
ncbi:MAG: 30S ribosomal protein S25e [Thermoproteus sp. AZ2]|jgi:small subunit ribosomal protein S25e|uniref:30S ribosomal protein S25e n=1 Tax=Thermoproteus sp. AZ2 TaxID=1609232 RepID=A0ACC6V2C3_9CREN|nr:MAG: 30S ribosomal protein S25 [Thermoproteus sp. AZ2]